jgi:hypothetical protein
VSATATRVIATKVRVLLLHLVRTGLDAYRDFDRTRKARRLSMLARSDLTERAPNDDLKHHVISYTAKQQPDGSAAMASHFRVAPAPAYADATAIRRTVLARLTTFERAVLWRWCIGISAIYAGCLAALLAILVLTKAEPLAHWRPSAGAGRHWQSGPQVLLRCQPLSASADSLQVINCE